MKLKEGLAKASREGRCWLCDPALCAGKLSCETGQEVVLCLLWRQNGYWRQYAEGICGQEDHILSCRSGGNRAYDLLNMVDRVRYTGVLGYALVSEINLALCIQGNVLKKSIALDRIVDIWLRFLVQVDNLCIAAALEVEHAVVIPAVLVITDQKTLWIG